jgi:lysine biosynthesis protein LysW
VLSKCVECRSDIDIPDPHPGDVIECPKCNIKMKVVSVNVNRVYLETIDEELEDAEGELES